MPIELPQAAADPAATLTKATQRAAVALDLTQKQLARALGVSEATASRLGRGRLIDPTSKEGELAVLFLRVHRGLDALVGGDASAARAWMHAFNAHLGGVPAELVQSLMGLVDVVEYLDAMRGHL